MSSIQEVSPGELKRCGVLRLMMAKYDQMSMGDPNHSYQWFEAQLIKYLAHRRPKQNRLEV
eukprot:12885116-Prorocentrum_lima.AAC.1